MLKSDFFFPIDSSDPEFGVCFAGSVSCASSAAQYRSIGGEITGANYEGAGASRCDGRELMAAYV